MTKTFYIQEAEAKRWFSTGLMTQIIKNTNLVPNSEETHQGARREDVMAN